MYIIYIYIYIYGRRRNSGQKITHLGRWEKGDDKRGDRTKHIRNETWFSYPPFSHSPFSDFPNTRNYKSEIPSEDAAENPLETSGKKCGVQSFAPRNLYLNVVSMMTFTIAETVFFFTTTYFIKTLTKHIYNNIY